MNQQRFKNKVKPEFLKYIFGKRMYFTGWLIGLAGECRFLVPRPSSLVPNELLLPNEF
jgi:hypothetical protein